MSASGGSLMSTPHCTGGLNVPQVARILPGPAGKLQQLAAAGALQQATPEVLGLRDCNSTNSSSTDYACALDACFQSSVWCSAQEFTAQQEAGPGTASQLHTIRMAKDVSLGKVPQMLVVLGFCQPSGSGSAFAKIKDPTGSMGGTLHSSVLQQQAELGPGCVLLLQQVSVFTPSPGTTYAAITARNIIRVWGAESPQDRIRNAQHAQQHAQQQPPWTQQQQAPPPAGASQLGLQQQQHLHVVAGGLSQQQQQQQQPQQGRVPPCAGRASLLPPASPHLQVLNGMRRRHTSQLQQPGLQVRVQQTGHLQEEQGEVSPAVSLGSGATHRQGGAGAGARPNLGGTSGEAGGRGLAGLLSQQQQKEQQHSATGIAARGSMLPPPPKVQPSTFRGQGQVQQPPAGQQQQQQQQQQRCLQERAENISQQSTAADDLAELFAPPRLPGGMMAGPSQTTMQQQQHHASQHWQQQQQQSQQGFQRQSLGVLQPPSVRNTLPNQLQQRPSTLAANPAANVHAFVQPDSMDVDALDAGDDDAMDDVVAAIFGSQLPPPAAGSMASQQQPDQRRYAATPGGIAAVSQQGGPSQKRFKPAATAATAALLPGGGTSAVGGLQQHKAQQGTAPSSMMRSHSATASGGAVFAAATNSSFKSQPQQQQQQAMPLNSPALSGAGRAAGRNGLSSYPASAEVPRSVRPFPAAGGAAAAAGGHGTVQRLMHGRQAVSLLDDLLGEDLEQLDG